MTASHDVTTVTFRPRWSTLDDAHAGINPETGHAYADIGDLSISGAELDHPLTLANALRRMADQIKAAHEGRVATEEERREGLAAARSAITSGIAPYLADAATVRQAIEDDGLGRAERAGVAR